MNTNNTNLNSVNPNNNVQEYGTNVKTTNCNKPDCVGKNCNCYTKETHLPGYDAKEKYTEHHGKGKDYESHTQTYTKCSESNYTN